MLLPYLERMKKNEKSHDRIGRSNSQFRSSSAQGATYLSIARGITASLLGDWHVDADGLSERLGDIGDSARTEHWSLVCRQVFV